MVPGIGPNLSGGRVSRLAPNDWTTMKIHSDKLNLTELNRALLQAQQEDDIDSTLCWDLAVPVGSRKRAHGFEVHLGTDTRKPGSKRRRPNPGTNRWHEPNQSFADWAARWDEWGYVIARLYKIDPDAIIGNYEDSQDFHHRTDGQFA